jgi:hypothetical protein
MDKLYLAVTYYKQHTSNVIHLYLHLYLPIVSRYCHILELKEKQNFSTIL